MTMMHTNRCGRHASLLLAAIVIGLTLWAGPAVAQPPPRAEGAEGGGEWIAEPKEEAEKLYQRARALQQDGKHDSARPLLEKALELHRRPDIAAALGQAELELGHYVSAVTHLTYALGLMPPGGDDTRAATAHLARAKQHVATLTFRVEPSNARVTIDGKPLESHAGDVFVLAGAHTLRAEHPGHQPVVIEKTFKPFVSERVELVLPRDGDPHATNGDGLPAGAITIGAIGIASVIAGVIMLGVGADKQSQHEDRALSLRADGGACGPQPTPGFDGRCAELAAIESDNRALVIGGGVATGVGLGLITASILWSALGSRSDPDPASAYVRITPAFSYNHQGLVLHGRF